MARLKEEWTKRIRPEDTPENCRALCNAVGISEAARLCDRLGGSMYAVPRMNAQGRPENGFSDLDKVALKALGKEAYTALCRARGGEQLAIPRAKPWYAATRTRIVREARAQGVTARKIAAYCELTEGQICGILETDQA